MELLNKNYTDNAFVCEKLKAEKLNVKILCKTSIYFAVFLHNYKENFFEKYLNKVTPPMLFILENFSHFSYDEFKF